MIRHAVPSMVRSHRLSYVLLVMAIFLTWLSLVLLFCWFDLSPAIPVSIAPFRHDWLYWVCSANSVPEKAKSVPTQTRL